MAWPSRPPRDCWPSSGSSTSSGTVASGWLSDKIDPRKLLAVYYALRGLSLMVLPSLFAATTEPSMLIFIVFYGLDWVATVPPTVALCRSIYGSDGAVVFGWVFGSHQVGAAIAAVARRPHPRPARRLRLRVVRRRPALPPGHRHVAGDQAC